jgi:hypothetical protein
MTVTVPPGGAGPRNPVVRYTMHNSGASKAAQVVAPSTTVPTMPGVTSETDLKDPLPIGPAGVDVAVTDRIIDCEALGDYLAIRGGATAAALWLSSAVPVSVEPADPRFRLPPGPASPIRGDFDTFVVDGDVQFQDAVLEQLAAICPSL